MEKWEPHPPKWENVSQETLQRHKSECGKFVAEFAHTSNCSKALDVFHQFLNRKIIRFVYDSNSFEDAGVDEFETEEIYQGILNGRHVQNPSAKEQETLNHFSSYLHAL